MEVITIVGSNLRSGAVTPINIADSISLLALVAVRVLFVKSFHLFDGPALDSVLGAPMACFKEVIASHLKVVFLSDEHSRSVQVEFPVGLTLSSAHRVATELDGQSTMHRERSYLRSPPRGLLVGCVGGMHQSIFE